MNFAPKVGPLVAELLSGFTALLLGFFVLPHSISLAPPGITVPAFGLIAWILGTFIDAVRNLSVEWALDKLPRYKLDWKFFVHGKPEQIAAVEEYFFSFYRIDMDMALAIVLFLFLGPLVLSVFAKAPVTWYSRQVAVILFLAATLFFLDARSLRREMKDYMSEIKGTT